MKITIDIFAYKNISLEKQEALYNAINDIGCEVEVKLDSTSNLASIIHKIGH